MRGVDRLDQNRVTYMIGHRNKNSGGQSSVSAYISVQAMHFKFTDTKKRT